MYINQYLINKLIIVKLTHDFFSISYLYLKKVNYMENSRIYNEESSNKILFVTLKRKEKVVMEIENVLKKLKIESLSQMQEETIGKILEKNKDIVVLSPTGSGKTLAYLLPLLELLDSKLDVIQAVAIVPGRELALQTHDVFNSLSSGLKSLPLYGGRATMDEHRELRKIKPQVIFATPGRLKDHLDKENFNAQDVKYLIIDEFDKCLKMGFQDEMEAIIARFPNIKQRILLSATDAKEIPVFVRMGKTERLNFISKKESQERITTFKVQSPSDDKLETLEDLLISFGQESTIVFLNFRDSVERVGEFLLQRGFIISLFHGGMDQKEREVSLYKFRNRSTNILIGTDLASRGLDIPIVDNIVHYYLPLSQEEYVHRIGRATRWTSKGKAFFLLGPKEFIPEYVSVDIQEYKVSKEETFPPKPLMVTLYIGKGKKDKISKGDVLGFLCKTGGLQAAEIGRIDVEERCCYVSVSREHYLKAINRLKGEKIKGLKTIIELIK